MISKIRILFRIIKIKLLVLYWRFKIWDAEFTGKYIIGPLLHWHKRRLDVMKLKSPLLTETYKSKGTDTDRYFGSRRHER